jgi:Type IV pilus assembly protein PilM
MPLFRKKTTSSRPNSSQNVVGLEFDNNSIRAIRVNHSGTNGYQVDALHEEQGNFGVDAELLEGLRKVKSQLSIGSKEHVVTTLAGKQVWGGEIAFRPLPESEMMSALKLEIRKTLHFESSGASLDYQVLAEPDEGRPLSTLLVTAAHNNLVQKQISLLERAGLRVSIIEVLPITLANAVWAQVGNAKNQAAHVGIHFGPQICTVSIDGETSPHFNRSIYFASEEVYGSQEVLTPKEKDKRIQILGDEISRTLAYYEKNFPIPGFGSVLILGNYSNEPGLPELVQKATGMRPTPNELLKRFGYTAPADPGKFGLSLALALREDL